MGVVGELGCVERIPAGKNLGTGLRAEFQGLTYYSFVPSSEGSRCVGLEEGLVAAMIR